MDDILYTSINRYFNTLSKLGYVNYDDVYNILYLMLIRDFIYDDFYGYITEDDYRCIEKSLYCLFGKSCLIPYPQYLTMGNLCLGNLSEMAYRIKRTEQNISELNDSINTLDDRIDINTENIGNNSNQIDINSNQIRDNSANISANSTSIEEIQETKVIKGNNEYIQIDDIIIS